MFFVRRAAAHALRQQPARQLCTIQPRTPRVITLRPVLDRSFHLTRPWLADEDKKPEASPAQADAADETVTTEQPIAAEEQIKEQSEDAQPQVLDASADFNPTAADALSESAGSTAQDSGPALNTSSYDANAMPSATAEGQVGGSAGTGREPAQQQLQDDQSLTDKAADFASSAAQTAQSAASSAGRQARQAYDNTAQKLQSTSAEFPPRTPRPAQSSYGQRATTGHGASNPPSRILYVGNLFFEVTAAQLEQEFSRFGEVANSRVVTDSRGLSKGFGYIEFTRQEDADRAMKETDQKVFEGRRMAVQYHVRRTMRMPERSGREANPPSKTLFIGNLSYQMSDKDLNDLFREIRNVLDVRVAIDRRSGQPRGFAHADFIDVASAERAKAHLEQKVIYGRQLKIDFSANSASTRQEQPRGEGGRESY